MLICNSQILHAGNTPVNMVILQLLDFTFGEVIAQIKIATGTGSKMKQQEVLSTFLRS